MVHDPKKYYQVKPHPHQQHSSGTEANFRSNVTEVMSGLMLSASACSYIFNHRSRVFLSSSHNPCSPCWTVRWTLQFFSWMWQCTPCFPHLNLNPIHLKPARVYEFMLLSAKKHNLYLYIVFHIFQSKESECTKKKRSTVLISISRLLQNFHNTDGHVPFSSQSCV